MTKRANSAREVVEQFGGLNRIPKPVREDLSRTAGSAIAGFYARTWTQRVEAEITNGRLGATEVGVLEFFEALADFEDAKSAAQQKRPTKALRAKLEASFLELLRVAESLGIPTSVSPSDNF